MNDRSRQRAADRFLRVTFVISLCALVVSLSVFFFVQRSESRRTPALSESSVVTYPVQDSTVPADVSPVSGTATLSPPAPVQEETLPAQPESDTPPSQSAEPNMSHLPEELRLSRENAGLNAAQIAAVKASQSGNYYYDRLGESEQTLYAELYHIIVTLARDVFVSATDAAVLEKVQNCVMNDHPEIFYLSGYYTTRYTLGEQTVGYSFSGRYLYDAQEIARRNKLIEEYVTRCLSELPAYADDYTRVKYVYDYLIANTSYQIDAPDNQNICSVMMGGQSVCQGYAKAAQLILNRAHVKATLVVGTVHNGETSGPHAWNLVLADGNWYYLDVTWGDASFRNGQSYSEGTNYDYLLTTTAEISRTHMIGSIVQMPLCDHMEDNYYVRERAYFTEASLEAFGALTERRRAEGASFVTFKCATDTVYRYMMTELVDNSRIFDYIHKAPGESLSFTRSDEHLSFTVWF